MLLCPKLEQKRINFRTVIPEMSFHIPRDGLKVVLRPWRDEDLEDLAQHANNANIAKFMTDGFPFPYTKEHGANFLERVQKFTPSRFFAIEVNNRAIGGIGIHPQEDIMRMNAELGYWLSEEYWGNGIITEAIKQIVQYGFTNFAIDRIFARPFGSNKASQKVLEKSGFKFEAIFHKAIIKNGNREDELIYAIRK